MEASTDTLFPLGISRQGAEVAINGHLVSPAMAAHIALTLLAAALDGQLPHIVTLIPSRLPASLPPRRTVLRPSGKSRRLKP